MGGRRELTVFTRGQHLLFGLVAHRRLVLPGRILKEQAGYQGGNVGSVGRHKDDTEATPDIDEELVGPGFGRLKGHQVTA